MKHLKINIVFSVVIKVLTLLLNLALIPLGIKTLKPDLFGIWVVLYSILTWLSFMDLGIGNSLRNRLLLAISSKRKDTIKQSISTSYFSIAFFVCTLLIVVSLLTPFIPWNSLFNVTAIDEDELTQLMLISFWMFGIQMILKNVVYVFHALHQSFIGNLLLLVSSTITYLTLLLITQSSHQTSIEDFLIVSLGSPIIAYACANIWLFSTRLKKFRPRWTSAKLSEFKLMQSQGSKFFIIQIFTLCLFQGNTLLISHYFGGETVTAFNASNRIFNTAVMAFTIVLNPIWSSYSQALLDKRFEWIGKTQKKLVSLWLMAAIGISCLLIFSNWIFDKWLSHMLEVPFDIHLSNALYAVIYILCAIFTYLINSSGKIFVQMIVYVAGSLLFLPLCLLGFNYAFTPSMVVFANCAIMLIITVILGIQSYKIIHQKAQGFWCR